ncbi:MAG: hypothetical protein HQ567_22170 [Candidatus Nealsonbacteria bacterium]|nr:hypothetical protein [Candidatus Nealsonbacteria bacterium]
MADVHETLSDSQKQAVRYLAEHSKQNFQFARHEVIAATGLTEDEYVRLVMFLEREETIQFFRHSGVGPYDSFSVASGILDVVHQLDHPPPKDYWKKSITWFRSKPWSIPVLVLAVVLPALVGYVTMIETLLRWMGTLQ